MFLAEPPPSQGDLRFRLFGFPVRIHPFFWVTTVLLGLNTSGQTPPAELLAWVAVVLVSILVHELGHAFMQRQFGGHPWITLLGLGGLASCSDCDRRPSSQILISLAGPAAGFAFIALIVAAMRLSGHVVGWTAGELAPVELAGIESAMVMSLLGGRLYWEPLATNGANSLFADLVQVNILWGLVNLLPIYPLDGGQVSRELFTLSNPSRGIAASLGLSAVVAGAMAAFALLRWHSFFTAILFGYLAYSSYRALEAYRDRRW